MVSPPMIAIVHRTRIVKTFDNWLSARMYLAFYLGNKTKRYKIVSL